MRPAEGPPDPYRGWKMLGGIVFLVIAFVPGGGTLLMPLVPVFLGLQYLTAQVHPFLPGVDQGMLGYAIWVVLFWVVGFPLIFVGVRLYDRFSRRREDFRAGAKLPTRW